MNQGNYNSDKKATSEDEIDLSKLFKAIISGLSAFFKALLRLFFLFIDTIVANVKLILLLLIIGTLLGILNFFNTKPYFESNMTMGSAYYRGQLIKNSIDKLNLLCKEGNYKTLAKVLKIPQKQAESLKEIEIQPVISPSLQLIIDIYKESEGTNRHLDSLIMQNQDTTFQVMVQVYDTTAINGLDSSLINYLKQNRYVKKRIEIERVNLNNRRSKLIKESGSLDTLKRNIALSYRNQAGGRSGTNNVILDDKGTNPIEVYREDFRLYEQQLKIDRMLYLNSEIEIIDPFIAIGEPRSGTIEKNILKGVLLGLGVSILIILFKILKIGMSKMRRSLKEPEEVSS